MFDIQIEDFNRLTTKINFFRSVMPKPLMSKLIDFPSQGIKLAR